LETVAAATGSFNFARGIGSQASVGAAVDEERWTGKTMWLCNLPELHVFRGIQYASLLQEAPTNLEN